MKKRQGQAMVEFALIAPMLFLLIFGLIWSGIMFMEYLHFSNQVRTVARQIAVTEKNSRTDKLSEDKEDELESLYTSKTSNIPKMYKPTVDITYSNGPLQAGDVTVTVTFIMEDYESLPKILQNIGFPPQAIKAIKYSMKMEGDSTSTSTTTD